MANVGVGSWISLALNVFALPIVVTVVTFLFSRFGQDELQRQRSVSESRIKRLEALEKALSVTETAKSELSLDIAIHDIQGELQRIVHEFADPIVLSREALEEWIKNRYLGHPSRNFTVPVNMVRAYRRSRILSAVFLMVFAVEYLFLIIFLNSMWLQNMFAQLVENEAHRSSTSVMRVWVSWTIIWAVSMVWFGLSPLLSVWSRRLLARRALRTLREKEGSGGKGSGRTSSLVDCTE